MFIVKNLYNKFMSYKSCILTKCSLLLVILRIKMLEIKKNYKKNIRSIFISKFCFKYNKSIFKQLAVNYCLVIKRKEKNKILFFFIMLLLIIGDLPKIIKARKRGRRIKQDEFLGFEYSVDFFKIFKFVNVYLPITDIVENLYFKFNQQEYRLTVKYFPIVNELDKICESNTMLLDYIQDYKLVLKFKALTLNWYLGECVIRSLNIPFISSNRF